jgi:effector-binding domain-containing protein
VFAWLANHHIAPAGPCFFQYLFIDNNNEMIIEVGVPVQNSVAGDDRFIGGTFPAGHYVTIIYRGDYKNIMEGHLALEAWIRQSDWREQRQITDNGIEWGSRTEFYLTDPAADPNPEKWETEIAFLLADKAHA